MWQYYNRLLHTRPLLTNIVTAGVVVGGGDYLAQYTEAYYNTHLSHIPHQGHNHNVNNDKQHNTIHIDINRLYSMTGWGLGTAPITYYWFRWLDKRFVSKRLHHVLGKILFNQLTYGISMNACFFYYMIATKEGITTTTQRDTVYNKYIDRMRYDFGHITVKSICWWMVFHTINFKYLPEHTRVLFQYSAGLLWNAYLSVVGHDQ